jgi:tetratricopeptide (TPR) repeat protein
MDKFSIQVEVFKQETKPVLEKNELTNIEFEKWNESYIAKKEFTDYVANKQLGFAIPPTNNSYQTYVEKASKQVDDDYFYINLKPEKQWLAKTVASKICILYDVSSSAQKKDTLKEIAVLEKYFSAVKNAKIQLITFSNEIHSNEQFQLKKGNWNELKNKLKNPSYDGATQLGALDLTKFDCNEFILISDGISNFGKSEMKTGKKPVMVISSTQSADFSYLKYIATATGGQFINLKNLTVDQAFKKLTSQPYQFISATYDKEAISEVYPSIPSNFTTNFSLAGQLKAENAEITLNFGFGSKVFESVKVKLDKKSLMTDNSLVSRIWAQKKISELDMLYEKNKDEIIAIGKKHSIVTRNTSLIVLDRIEDYVQYEIVPPKELQKEYFEIVENQNKEKQRFEQEQLEKVVEYFNARVKWWETKFTKEKKIVNKDPKKNGNVTDSTVVEVLEIVEDEMNVSEEAISDAVIMVEDVITEENGGYLHGGKKKDKSEKDRVSSIKLNAWDPQTPYMIKIKEAQNKYQTYLELKKTYASTPSFYLDVANYFVKLGDKKLGLRILSNIAEMEVQNHELMRILAHRLEQLEYYDLAIAIYEEVVKIRSEEPQSFRDLSLCLAADKQYQKALDIIYKAIKKPWDSRFPEVEGIMAVEMNRIISKAGSAVDTKNIDKRLIKDMPVDIRIVLNWDTDNSDMDLWVTDPYEVKCFYSHPLTYTGGRMSRDFTGGYGPEEFMIKEALTGQYKVQANYYGSRAQKITGPTTIYLEIYTNYGKPNEKKETITMQLAEKAEVVDIGVMEFGK